ncbi:DUF22 domain-containing protein [Methanobacterium alkalithermotolerans]|uniref:DUF22 domain-containing protein n=1 Tax=Methanobacterium alkalithermotolerans TaxID=2731220 RepID=A0A8T8K4Q6_9EURY|nr:DUF22 domain-containing protein [Methanobacterium alkalithermotolerans]QUH22967.1 DUF22 domain-containing protein [Methanobacterium alkalithermotolerans]RJS48218.1 MAG: hypothetical protein CIT03_09365 [Methanobacterium sp.]
MVRILTRLGEVKKDMEQYRDELVDFKIGTISGNLRAIIADEDMEIKAGEVKPIKIKKISLPGSHIAFMCAYAANQLGHTIAAGEETPLPLSMDRNMDHATFVAAMDGSIQKEDLLGVLILLPVELTH